MPVSINASVPGGPNTPGHTDPQLRLPLGYVVVTRAVARLLMAREDGRTFVMSCLYRHACGDWGDLDAHDAEANDQALTTGARILSSYLIPDEIRRSARDGETGAATTERNGSGPREAIAHERLWIITEVADERGIRSQTTMLFPSDY